MGGFAECPLWVDTVEKLPDAASDETLLRQVGSPSTKDSGWSHCGFDCCVTDSRSDFINGIGHSATSVRRSQMSALGAVPDILGWGASADVGAAFCGSRTPLLGWNELFRLRETSTPPSVLV